MRRGTGHQVTRFLRDVDHALAKTREPIELQPFLDWMRDETARRLAAGVPPNEASYAALARIGWGHDSGNRRWYRWRYEKPSGIVERAYVEQALEHAGVPIWELYPELAAQDASVEILPDAHCPACRETVTPIVDQDGLPICPWCDTPTLAHRRGGWKRPDMTARCKFTDLQLQALHVAHVEQGMSINRLAKQTYNKVGYKSRHSAARAISAGFKRLGLPARDRIEATRLASTTHGRGGRDRDEQAYRRFMKAQRGWNSLQGPGRPRCKAVKTQPPGKGQQCTRHALADSDYCTQHDPRRELERQAHMARMRRRRPAAPVLPMGPFTAWLNALHAEHGSWAAVARLVGVNRSAVHAYAHGLGTNNKPKDRISKVTVERWARAVGVTVSDIYRTEAEQEAA